MTEEKKDDLKMAVGFCEETNQFQLIFKNDDKVMLQIGFLPHEFEKMTNDFVRLIKNYNLYQIELYKERQANGEAGMENGEAQSQGSCASCEQPKAIEQGESCPTTQEL